jgi:hypothetical protein
MESDMQETSHSPVDAVKALVLVLHESPVCRRTSTEYKCRNQEEDCRENRGYMLIISFLLVYVLQP